MNNILVKLEKFGITPVTLALFALLALAPVIIEDQFIIHLLIISLMYGTLAMGFDLSAGFINIANFGYSAFMGIGAYTSGLLATRLGWSPWAGMVAGMLLAALLGLFTGILTLRLRGMFAAILAWFLGMALMSLALILVDLTRGALGLSVDLLFDTPEKAPFFYVIFAICLGTYVLVKWLVNSHIGLAFKAIGADQEAAESSGVNITGYKVLNFTVSCAIAGLVGGFYAHFLSIVTPDMMHTKNALEILVLAYIGGRGSIWGGLVAAIFLVPAFEYLKFLEEFRLVFYGLMLIAVMLIYPDGFSGLVDALKMKWAKRHEWKAVRASI